MENNILLGHGSGGRLSHDLIKDLFVKYFSNDILDEQTDAAVLNINSNRLSFTTDSFVVDPIFFPGGDIGKLAIAGTVNDLAVSGAKPLYLSAGFIIEEGFLLKDLEVIVKSMAEEAQKAGVKIVTGDTKVINRGKCDKVFINTTGVGEILQKHVHIGAGKNIQAGVVMEAMEFAIESAKKGTMLENANWVINEIPALARCSSCKHEFETHDLFSPCPECGNPFSEIYQGKELRVKTLKVE